MKLTYEMIDVLDELELKRQKVILGEKCAEARLNIQEKKIELDMRETRSQILVCELERKRRHLVKLIGRIDQRLQKLNAEKKLAHAAKTKTDLEKKATRKAEAETFYKRFFDACYEVLPKGLFDKVYETVTNRDLSKS